MVSVGAKKAGDLTSCPISKRWINVQPAFAGAVYLRFAFLMEHRPLRMQGRVQQFDPVFLIGLSGILAAERSEIIGKGNDSGQQKPDGNPGETQTKSKRGVHHQEVRAPLTLVW